MPKRIVPIWAGKEKYFVVIVKVVSGERAKRLRTDENSVRSVVTV